MVAGMEPTRINAHLTLREYRGGIRYGTDALLLASFVRGGRRARCADLGTGCGVIPLLLLASGRCGEARGFEVQAEYAALAAENARDNGLDGRFAVVQGTSAASVGSVRPAGRITSPPTRPICARTAADATPILSNTPRFTSISAI